MKTKANNEYWEKITRWFSNEMSTAEKKHIEQWTGREDGKELLMDIDTKMKYIDKTAYMFNEKTDLAWDKLHRKIVLDQKTDNTKSFFRGPNAFVGIAASIVILLGLSLGIFKMLQNKSPYQELQTALNQSQVKLSDGTMVYLNGNSSITYPEDFTGNTRTVQLRGEAFFDVKRDEQHPFIIETKNAAIQVLGTSFNVRTGLTDNKVEVLVASGTVRLEDRKNPEEQLVLNKGDFGSLKDNRVQFDAPMDENYMAWKTKVLTFKETPLHSVVQTLNRAYAIHLELASDQLSNLKLTSKYDKLDAGALIEAMCLTFNLEQKTQGNRIILYSKTP